MKTKIKDMFKVGDHVSMYKRDWIVEKVYPEQKCYKLNLLKPFPNETLTHSYPMHDEITGLIPDWEERQITIGEIPWNMETL